MIYTTTLLLRFNFQRVRWRRHPSQRVVPRYSVCWTAGIRPSSSRIPRGANSVSATLGDRSPCIGGAAIIIFQCDLGLKWTGNCLHSSYILFILQQVCYLNSAIVWWVKMFTILVNFIIFLYFISYFIFTNAHILLKIVTVFSSI